MTMTTEQAAPLRRFEARSDSLAKYRIHDRVLLDPYALLPEESRDIVDVPHQKLHSIRMIKGHRLPHIDENNLVSVHQYVKLAQVGMYEICVV